MKSFLEIAYDLCIELHSGQKDKNGNDYSKHPIEVSEKLKNEDEKIVALLHDVFEDTNFEISSLKNNFCFKEKIIDALIAITRRKDEKYFDYIKRCKDNQLAKKVKIADLIHNLDLSRLKQINDKDINRNKRYLKALEILILD